MSDIAPMPHEGWSRTVIVRENAIVAPPTISKPRTPSGVWCDGDVMEASMWRHDGRMSLPLTEEPLATKVLKGHYLFGGMFYAHFGHFITETIGRLWANDNSLDGILMTPKHPNLNLKKWQRELLQILNVKSLPILVEEPILVERLSIPGQGFGLGSISLGTPEFKSLVDQTIRRLPADGPEKIYISRTQYAGQGGIIAEKLIESNLEKSGYTAVYPERLGWKEQISLYRAAKKIISIDSSALHMVGLAADPGTDVAVLVRRNNFEWNCMSWQLESFLEKAPAIINVLVAEYVAEGKKKPTHQSWGVIDFDQLREELASRAFISPSAEWHAPSEKEVTDDIAQARLRSKFNMIHLPVTKRVGLPPPPQLQAVTRNAQ